MSAKEAHREARLAFGGPQQVNKQHGEASGLPFLESLMQDLVFGLRFLRRSPGFTIAVTSILALAIGANTAIFSVLDAVILKKLPVKNPDELVLFASTVSQGRLSNNGPPGGKLYFFSYPLYSSFRDQRGPFQDICAFSSSVDSLNVGVDGTQRGISTQLVHGKEVSGNYFTVLGIRALFGRTLIPLDDQPGSQPATVISYRYWSTRFDRDASVVGRLLNVNGIPFTIVGIAPSEFFGEKVESNPAELWLPLAFQSQLMKRESWLKEPNLYWLNLIGRLNPGITINQAQVAVNVQTRQYFQSQMGSQLSPKIRELIDKSYVELSPAGRGISLLRRIYSEPLHILMAGVLVILLIACCNIIGLLLARGGARQREISVRLALGAKRERLIRQLLTESLLLVAFGGGLGVILGAWGVNVITMLVARNTPLDIGPDWKVLLFTLGVSVASGIGFGILPALRVTRIDLTPSLKTGCLIANPAGPYRLGLASGLVVFEIACALPLLMGASLMIRSLQTLEDQDLGLSPEHVLLVGIDPRLAGYKGPQLDGLYNALLDRISTLPGVQSASLASYSPISGSGWSEDITVPGYVPRTGQDMNVPFIAVGPRYFETEGIPLLIGRPIVSGDVKGSPEVGVVNEAFVRDFLPNRNPIGTRFSPTRANPADSLQIEIVGVAKDAKFFNLHEQTPPMVFLSAFQAVGDLAYQRSLEIRVAGNPTDIASGVRHALADVDKNVPISEILPLEQQIHDHLNQERMISELSGFFGVVALLLACTGLYGLMSYTVARRTNEFAIRMALGAPRGTTLKLILKQAASLTLLGLALGLLAAFILTRLISSLLYNVSAHDPLLFASVSLLLMLVAVGACCIPAWRAMQVDPIVALRYE